MVLGFLCRISEGHLKTRVQENIISQEDKVFDMQYLIESVLLCSMWILCGVHDFMLRKRCVWFRAVPNGSTRNGVPLLRGECFYF